MGIKGDQQFHFFILICTLPFTKGQTPICVTVCLSFPPVPVLSAEVISLLFYIICHHQKGWIHLQYLVAVQLSCAGRVIDLLLCILMKGTAFVLARSPARVLLNHPLPSVSICPH